MFDLQKMKRDAAGQWQSILSDLAPDLADAVWNPRKHWLCPVHGGRDGLRAFNDVASTGGVVCNSCGPKTDGFATLMWAKAYDFRAAANEVNNWLRNPVSLTKCWANSTPDMAFDIEGSEKKADAIGQAWQSSTSPKRYVPRYFRHRGLGKICHEIPSTIRESSAHRYYGSQQLSVCFPAMVVPVSDHQGNTVSLHRTYLKPNGEKAGVLHPKKFMPPAIPQSLTSCAIWLFPPSAHMAICEGIETALAVHLMTGLPVIAAGNATLMGAVSLPGEVRLIDIYADKDRSRTGEQAAERLARQFTRLRGRSARILLPDIPIPQGAKSIDWLDVYNFNEAAA